jgi:hypothetical protein
MTLVGLLLVAWLLAWELAWVLAWEAILLMNAR